MKLPRVLALLTFAVFLASVAVLFWANRRPVESVPPTPIPPKGRPTDPGLRHPTPDGSHSDPPTGKGPVLGPPPADETVPYPLLPEVVGGDLTRINPEARAELLERTRAWLQGLETALSSGHPEALDAAREAVMKDPSGAWRQFLIEMAPDVPPAQAVVLVFILQDSLVEPGSPGVPAEARAALADGLAKALDRSHAESVRRMGGLLAVHFPGDAMQRSLLDAAGTEPIPSVRGIFYSSLGDVGEPSAAPVLKERLGRAEDLVEAIPAALALARMGERFSDKALEAYLRATAPDILPVLAERGDPATNPQVTRLAVVLAGLTGRTTGEVAYGLIVNKDRSDALKCSVLAAFRDEPDDPAVAPELEKARNLQLPPAVRRELELTLEAYRVLASPDPPESTK